MDEQTRERIDRLGLCLEGAIAVLDMEERAAEVSEAERKAGEERVRQQTEKWLTLPSPFAVPEEMLKLTEEREHSLGGQLAERLSVAQCGAMRWEAALGEAEDHLMRLWADNRLKQAVEPIS